MSDDRTVRILHEDSTLRVSAPFTRYGDGPWAMTYEGVVIELRSYDILGESSWVRTSRLPEEHMRWVFERIVHEYVLGWKGDRPELTIESGRAPA